MNTEQNFKNSTQVSNDGNTVLPAIKIGRYDSKGVEMKVGDIIQRIYKYEIRLKDNKPYAHILDGSNFHLSVKYIDRDFSILNGR